MADMEGDLDLDEICKGRDAAMKIAAITMVYNEALILPYFFRHYEYLDEIHVLYETDSTDDTLKILNQTPNAVIKKCHIKDGFDDIDKVALINDTLRGIKADWVYVVDSDEFIFPPNESPSDFLSRQNYDVVRAAMFRVFRHRTDNDLDPSLPPVPQRFHGMPDVFSADNAKNVKPIVVKPSSKIRFLPGNHAIKGNIIFSPEFYLGAHWQLADPSIAVARKMQCRVRMSERNKALGMSFHNHNVTEEGIRAECDGYLDSPIIEALRPVNNTSPAEMAALSNKSFVPESVMVELRNQLKDKEKQIIDANIDITGSINWRIIKLFHKKIDTILPLGTKRRQFVKSMFLSLRRS
ncbi:MAG: glycosyltransferase family 2 protein [Dehalococcoidia bacterium]|jgi:hypothetical protein